MPFTLPSRFETEEWFARLRAIILNVLEIGLLLFAAYQIFQIHLTPSVSLAAPVHASSSIGAESTTRGPVTSNPKTCTEQGRKGTERGRDSVSRPSDKGPTRC